MFWLVLATCHKVLQEKEKLKKKLVTSRNIRFSKNVQIQWFVGLKDISNPPQIQIVKDNTKTFEQEILSKTQPLVESKCKACEWTELTPSTCFQLVKITQENKLKVRLPPKSGRSTVL